MRNLRLGNAFAALALGGVLILATAPKAHADNDGRSRAKTGWRKQTISIARKFANTEDTVNKQKEQSLA
jgi:hypothetical protein